MAIATEGTHTGSTNQAESIKYSKLRYIRVVCNEQGRSFHLRYLSPHTRPANGRHTCEVMACVVNPTCQEESPMHARTVTVYLHGQVKATQCPA